MLHRFSPVKLSLPVFGLALWLVSVGSAWAAAAPAHSDAEVVKKECGACHYPYARDWLPAYSWKQILDHLDDHFGDDASIDEKTRQRILSYMVGKRSTAIPLRVTEMDWWRNVHGGATIDAYAQKNGFSLSNCEKCHR